MGESKAQAFSAFVSYSHADKKAAQKLHRRLEGYRLPKHVAAQLSDKDESAKLGQIFRDREDLPAAEDLSTSVKAALEVSQALIVLCSPNAKASPWVAREIELFRELHPDRPVLAALIDGEPEDAFPLPLTQGGEPLAADLRKTGDGPRLGFLKIVAGIAGVPLDALVQRDAQRRLRRVMLVTGGAVLAMLAMAIMTIVAIQSRNEAQAQRQEAQHQQAQADGLIGYMLGDLREDLKGVGRLDIMTAVNKRAMKYFENQADLTALPIETLEKRAFVLHGWGEDDLKRDDLEMALEKFNEAHRVTKELLSRDSESPDRIFAHAQSEYWVGRVDELKRNFSDALLSYQKYHQMAVALHLKEPQKVRSLLERAYAYNNIGIVQLKSTKDNDSAKDSFEKAINWFERAHASQPWNASISNRLANAHGWLADAFFAKGHLHKSKEQREKEEAVILRIMEADSKNSEHLYRLMVAQRAIAVIDENIGHTEEAESNLALLVMQVKQQLHNEPSSARWRRLYERLKKQIEGINRRY